MHTGLIIICGLNHDQIRLRQLMEGTCASPEGTFAYTHMYPGYICVYVNVPRVHVNVPRVHVNVPRVHVHSTLCDIDPFSASR